MSIQAVMLRESFPHKGRKQFQDKLPGPTNELFAMMAASLSFGRNEEIYGEGEPAEYLYAVQSGFVRTAKIRSGGRRQIGAFCLPGDVFGFEAGDEHSFSAEALTPSVVCIVKRALFNSRIAGSTVMMGQLLKLTAAELQRTQDHILLLIKGAHERVASFLLEMANRNHSNDEVELPMCRQDIADYLGLTIETVSRTLARLENSGVITLSTSRHIILRNRAALIRMNA
jgi:CRP-like cAMP-binding protein